MVVHQSQFLVLLNDIAQFHLIALQELSACRHVEEYVFNHEVGTFGAHIRLLTFAFRCVNHNFCAKLCSFSPCAEFHLCDCRY